MRVVLRSMKREQRGPRYLWKAYNKTGVGKEIWQCGNCNRIFTFLYDSNPKEAGWFFCPHCGYPKEYYEAVEWDEEVE